ncbi:MAG: ribbon-helix-helix domain-containing protein [Candidatus Thermoplasmatota archaeon]|nr:ribbon-helix-helix domain-containing protein [Candidatus Thermoplasmatota archaeon]
MVGDTITNGSVTVRLAPHDLDLIDKKVQEGLFTSRSDVIRYSIRHTLNEIDSKERNLDILANIVKEANVTLDDVRTSVRKARKEVYTEVYGNE